MNSWRWWSTLIPAINTFFDKVLVMAQEPALRRNRLALVGQIANLSRWPGRFE